MEYLNIILISVSLVLSLVCMIVSIIVLSKLKNTSFSGLQDENIRREVAQGLSLIHILQMQNLQWKL